MSLDEDPPLVSVIVAAYNARAYIARALDSALSQTWPAIEIIVVDDASRDGTAAFVAARYGHERRLHLVPLETNHGPGGARNAGIARARGDWIAILDADDAWLPDRLTTLLAHAEGADLLADNLQAFDAHSRKVTGAIYPAFARQFLSARDLLDAELPRSPYDFGFLKPIIRATMLERSGVSYRQDVRTGEDFVFCLQLLLAGARLRVIDEPLYVYTTPIGASSGKPSPFSHTRFWGDKFIQVLRQVREQNVSRMDEETRLQFDRRIAQLTDIAPILHFHHARDRRQWLAIVNLLLTNRALHRKALRRLWRMLSRRRAPLTSSRDDRPA